MIQIKNIYRYNILKAVAKSIKGATENNTYISVWLLACLHTTASRITGHSICKISLTKYCTVFSSIM